MSTEENKQLARRFVERIDAHDIAGALELLSDDATYWIAGNKAVIPSAGPHRKPGLERIFRLMDEQLKGSLRMSVTNAVAEGDQVALEAVSRGELRNGRVYANQYHMLMTVRGGKIVAVKEYLDTEHVLATWFTPAPA